MPNKSKGVGKIRVGGNFNPQKCKFWYFLPYFSIFTPKFVKFCNFFPKNANLDNFFPKKVHFWKIFHSWKWKYGEIFFHQKFFGRIFTYALHFTIVILSWQIDKESIVDKVHLIKRTFDKLYLIGCLSVVSYNKCSSKYFHWHWPKLNPKL